MTIFVHFIFTISNLPYLFPVYQSWLACVAFSEPPIYLSSFFRLLCVIVAWWLFSYFFSSLIFFLCSLLWFLLLLLAQFRRVPLIVAVAAVIFDLMPLLLSLVFKYFFGMHPQNWREIFDVYSDSFVLDPCPASCAPSVSFNTFFYCSPFKFFIIAVPTCECFSRF